MSVVDYDQPDALLHGLYEGVITDNEDPKGLMRVKIRIPGIVEPSTGWAFPIGVPGGGGKDRGLFFTPNVGSEVAVFFKHGDPDHPRYMPAMWGEPDGAETPDASDSGDPEVVVLAMGAYDLVCDGRASSKGLKIVDKSDGENLIEFDGLTKQLTLSSKVGVKITSTGIVEISGLTVLINNIPAGFGQV